VRVVLFAYHTLGARCLEVLLGLGAEVALVVTHADDPAEHRWFASVADTARARGLPVLAPASPNTADVAAHLRSLRPDFFVSVMYRRLLAPELLAIPQRAAVNLHPSLLPRYRGRAPINWVLVHGETETGVTLHHMVAEADAGDIIAQERIAIDPEDTALTLYRKVEAVGPALLARLWPLLVEDRALRWPQDHARATVYARRRPEDGRVAWHWPAARIANMIRAVTHPFPGAFVGDGAARLYLWSGQARAGAATSAPGTVLEVRPGEGLLVAAGEGAVLVTAVQAAGGPEMRADSWAAAAGLSPGQRLPGAS
jgi:UDP-4-amino-4-deoxy-L-arabinose formyltransferase/UDP-glucuronic acid dehydrogenase (UDP-4-keto-hexauronic acid decarboxylating)